MNQTILPCHDCKGLCCGPVLITEPELRKIKKKVKTMPKKKRTELQNHFRFPGTCMFYHLEEDRCGIYSARPDICRNFGHHQDLVCFRNPDAAVKSNFHLTNREYIGTLSIDFTWKDFG